MNTYWRSIGRGRVILSEKGREFRLKASAAVMEQGRPAKPFSGRVVVEVHAYPPDRRRRDLDNLLKPVLDALTHEGILLDDEQIDDLRIVRGPTIPPGSVTLDVIEL